MNEHKPTRFEVQEATQSDCPECLAPAGACCRDDDRRVTRMHRGRFAAVDRAETQRVLELELDALQTRAAAKLEEQIRMELRVWLARHPRRALRFLDAMGSICIWVEEPLTNGSRQLCEFETDPRLKAGVQDLDDLVVWACEQTDLFKIALGDIQEWGSQSEHAYFDTGGTLHNSDGTRSIFDDVDE